MLSIKHICCLLLTHYIADFICQANSIALKKSSNNLILSLHILIYTAILSVTTLLLGLPIWFAVLNGAMHWITDYCSSRMSKHYYEQQRMSAFWNVIGLDQLIHTVTLMWTCNWFI